jgi:hypothetical protein
MPWYLAPSATSAGTADQVKQRTVAATAPAEENQTYCSKRVRSSQATPMETAQAAPG